MANIDGIAPLSYEIKDMDGYRKLKAMIEPDLGTQLVITNISYLGRLSVGGSRSQCENGASGI